MIRRRWGFTLVELMIVVAIIGILAALAIPNFIKYQARTKQSEAKTTLRGLSTAQKNYFSENDRFAANLSDVNFQVERGNRYAYMAALSPTSWQSRAGAVLPTNLEFQGMEVDCWKMNVGGACVAQPARPGALTPFSVVYEGAALGPSDTGVTPGNNGGFVIEARGTVDNDDVMDIWLVSNGSIQVSLGPCNEDNGAPGGIPASIYNDVMCP